MQLQVFLCTFVTSVKVADWLSSAAIKWKWIIVEFGKMDVCDFSGEIKSTHLRCKISVGKSEFPRFHSSGY